MIAQWTVRECLTAFEIYASRELREEFWHRLTLCALTGAKPPAIPALLADHGHS